MSTVHSPKGLRISDEVHTALKIRAAQTGESMGQIAERALRRELGMMDKRTTPKEVQARIDLDEVRTAYSNGVTEHEAIQIPWDTVRAILGHDHTGDPDEDRQLVEALIAAGAPEWVRDAEGWIDEYGWGLIGPEIVDAEPCPTCRGSSDGRFDADRGTWTVYRGGWINCPDCKGTGISG